METDSITCPHCHTPFKLTESLAAPLIAQAQKAADLKIAKFETELRTKSLELKTQQDALKTQREALDEEITKRMRDERNRIAADEAKKARAAVALEAEQTKKQLAETNELLKQRDIKLTEALNMQAETLRKQRELDDKTREMDLTIEKKVAESLQSARDQGKRAAEDDLKLKVQEKEQVITSMQRQIEELRRRAEQGSQQLQGEVVELEIEALLKLKFPLDTIEPVAKGESGADVLQRVTNPIGQPCGTILWESKRTKAWSDGWLSKLRDDQRKAKSDIAILVTHTLPKTVTTFDLIDNVWVTAPHCAIPLAIAIRHAQIEIASARTANDGQQTKAELMYQYLTGPRFRHHVNAFTEKFQDMREDLDRERKMMTKQWAKREQQITGLMETTAGMYGDLQGIAGRSLVEVEGLEVRMLEDGDQVADTNVS